ncbi:MAG TPA: hypothetical protein VM009_00040 [Terriglobales bacterium]|nr:hypothetical protein [Terriglobales bacterium]
MKRLYWIQFEGYLPSNTHTYDYSDQPLKFQYGGREWLADIRASSLPATEENPNSDGGRYRAMLRAKGYVLPQEAMRVRMVNLDAAKRNELMIIYLEDLSPLGLTAADVKEGGRGQARWAGIQQELLARAKAGMKVQ